MCRVTRERITMNHDVFENSATDQNHDSRVERLIYACASEYKISNLLRPARY